MEKVFLSDEKNDFKYVFNTTIKGREIHCSIIPKYAGFVMIFSFSGSIILGENKRVTFNIFPHSYEEDGFKQTEEDYKKASLNLLDQVVTSNLKKDPSLLNQQLQTSLF